jgi:hypothetical protein
VLALAFGEETVVTDAMVSVPRIFDGLVLRIIDE